MMKIVRIRPGFLLALLLLAVIVACAPPAVPTSGSASDSHGVTPTPTSTPEAPALVASPTPAPTLTPTLTPTITPTPGLNLVGHIWQLDSYATVEGGVEKALNDAPSKIQFAPDGKFSGNTGCNGFFGNYKLEGESLTLNIRRVTLHACTDRQADQEAAILSALKKVHSYQIQKNSLALLDADGVVLLSYFALPNSELLGVTWHLAGLNNGKGGVITNLATKRITMMLDDDGRVSGNGGCNDYSGSYQIDGASLTFGMMIATEMACPEPEGIMETENAFLTMFPKVSSYEIQDEKLVFFDKSGVKLAYFTPGQ